ncbi:MAG TPA: sugar ABC transporter permease [Bacilli bacterium]|jgi:multiple sugar transport system permease protein|nr:sugar ABC transporter permease [Bacilli bacterium]
MEQSKVKNPRLAKFAKSLKRHWPLFIFLGPYALLFITFFIYPFFYGIYISFFRWNLFEPSASTYVGFENFQRALFGVGEITIWRDYFWNGLRNTVLFVVLSVPFLIILPLIIAILLDLEPRFYKAFRVIFFMPTVLSVSAVAIIFKWQFDTNAGLVNGILSLFGLGDTAWLNTQPGAWIVIVVTTIWWTIGTNTVIFGAGLKEVDKAQYEAAELDGCNYFKVLWHISLPNIRNQMFICTITTIIASFNIYGQPHIITGGGPERTTTVLMMVIRGLLSGSNAQPGLAAAMALLLGIVIISVSLIQHFHNKRQARE